MNERINQLRLEAGISRLHDEPKFMVAVSEEGTVIEPLDGLEKFAESIIKEIELYIEESEGDTDYLRFLIDKRLKNYAIEYNVNR